MKHIFVFSQSSNTVYSDTSNIEHFTVAVDKLTKDYGYRQLDHYRVVPLSRITEDCIVITGDTLTIII